MPHLVGGREHGLVSLCRGARCSLARSSCPATWLRKQNRTPRDRPIPNGQRVEDRSERTRSQEGQQSSDVLLSEGRQGGQAASGGWSASTGMHGKVGRAEAPLVVRERLEEACCNSSAVLALCSDTGSSSEESSGGLGEHGGGGEEEERATGGERMICGLSPLVSSGRGRLWLFSRRSRIKVDSLECVTRTPSAACNAAAGPWAERHFLFCARAAPGRARNDRPPPLDAPFRPCCAMCVTSVLRLSTAQAMSTTALRLRCRLSRTATRR